ncbi:MAG: cytochrome c [Litoreibacter sp.]|nr:cytochrome c [Litoreibacter sp.]
MRQSILAFASVSLITTTVAFAGGHGGNPAVNARNAHMSLYGFNLGILGDMAKGTTEYDSALATEAANNLAALAAFDQTAYWIEGTEQDAALGSRAKAEIWSDAAGWEEQMKAMEDGAASLAAVAGNGLEALQGGMRVAGSACGSCHKAFRGPRN